MLLKAFQGIPSINKLSDMMELGPVNMPARTEIRCIVQYFVVVLNRLVLEIGTLEFVPLQPLQLCVVALAKGIYST